MATIRPPVLLVLLLAIVQASGEPCARYQDDQNRITLHCINGQNYLDSRPFNNVQALIVTGRIDPFFTTQELVGNLLMMPDLVEATINYASIRVMYSYTSPNWKLEKVDLSNNLIYAINPLVWNNMPNLRVLNLNSNGFHVLQPYQFQNLQKLQVLDLSKNSLEKLNNKELDGLANLKELRLNNNRLKMLGDDSFRSMVFEYLDLSGNGLTSISASAFSDLNCTVLKLDNNLLNTTELRGALSGLKDLNELDLSSNQFKSLPADMFTALENLPLEHLNLSNNQLKELPKLPDFKMIKELDFSRNQITSISKKRSDIEFFQNFWHRLETRQLYLYLQHNQLNCQSCDVEVLKIFESKNYKCNESEEYCLRCADPGDLMNRKIVDLQADNSSSSTSKDDCEPLLDTIRGHHPTKSNFIYFLIITILTVVFFVSIVLLVVFREKVFGSCNYSIGTFGDFSRFLKRKKNKPANISELAQRKRIDEDDHVQSNGNQSNKPDTKQEICLISFDPPKFVYPNRAIDVTMQSAKNGVAPFENAVQQFDFFL